MKLKQIFPASILLAVLAVCGLSCGANLFPIQEDANLGKEIDQEIKANPNEYPPYNNDRVRSYLQSMVNTIVASPKVKYRGTFPYTVTVINDDKTVNAFATPGGYVYVYTGLLRFCDNEATLAGILAHEIAHAEQRHGTEHMTQALGISVLLGIISTQNKDRSAIVDIAASSAALLATLANSRSDELEADTQGFGYLQSTQWWPGGIKMFFERILQEEGRGTSLFEEWLSTHPAPEDRLVNINKLLRENNIAAPTQTNLKTTEYRTMLKNLR